MPRVRGRVRRCPLAAPSWALRWLLLWAGVPACGGDTIRRARARARTRRTSEKKEGKGARGRGCLSACRPRPGPGPGPGPGRHSGLLTWELRQRARGPSGAVMSKLTFSLHTLIQVPEWNHPFESIYQVPKGLLVDCDAVLPNGQEWFPSRQLWFKKYIGDSNVTSVCGLHKNRLLRNGTSSRQEFSLCSLVRVHSFQTSRPPPSCSSRGPVWSRCLYGSTWTARTRTSWKEPSRRSWR